jgi:dolichol-phosphate mannosyltransferase
VKRLIRSKAGVILAAKTDIEHAGRAIRLAVVIPLANEQDTVVQLLARVTAQLENSDLVFCVLDNVSTDSTRQLVDTFATSDPRVVCVWAPEGRSVVDAYFAGYRAALDSGATWILEMDGGLSHSPEEIPRFLRAMGSGVDFAGGSRFIKGSSWSGPMSRYVVSRGGTVLATLLLHTRMRDMTSGFECFTRPALQYVVDQGVRSKAHFFQTEIRYLMHDMHWTEIPISYRSPSARLGGSSLRDAFSNLWVLRRSAKQAKRKSRSYV